ncbi:MAG TPA: IS1380 family transposase, partial [Flavobacteriaceae bacterium]|nr:IS1380 family transposase [Flavobacteriaceae bacterium]
NAGIKPLLDYTDNIGIFQEFEQNLLFEQESTEKIKMNHIKTLLAGNFIGVDKLERYRQLESDPLIKAYDINVRKPENISRFLSNFDFKTTQMLRNISMRIFKKILRKSNLEEITIDIDSSVLNVEGNQEGATKGYNPKYRGNKCYNALYAFCDQLKAFITGFNRPGNAYTANGTAELIKEIIANLKNDVKDITFRMDSGYFNEEIIKTIEQADYKYIIKAKKYASLMAMIDNNFKNMNWEKHGENQEAAFYAMKLDNWEEDRKFIIVRELKPEEERRQGVLFESHNYNYFIYVTNMELELSESIYFYQKRGNSENYIKESKYDLNIGTLLLKPFWANEALFQIAMLVYNIFLMFKMAYLSPVEYRQQIKTFRLKYIYVAGQLIKAARQTILKLMPNYPHKELFATV